MAWQNTEGATKTPPQGFPAPMRRPGDEPPEAPSAAPLMGGQFATPMPVDEFLRKRAEREQRWRNRHKMAKGGT